MKTRRTHLFETSNRPVRKCNASLLPNWELGPVSQKFRNFSSLFRVPQFHLYRWNAGVLSHQTLICNPLCFFLRLKHVKRPAFENKRVAVWTTGFSGLKVLGNFEKSAPCSWLTVLFEDEQFGHVQLCQFSRTVGPFADWPTRPASYDMVSALCHILEVKLLLLRNNAKSNGLLLHDELRLFSLYYFVIFKGLLKSHRYGSWSWRSAAGR